MTERVIEFTKPPPLKRKRRAKKRKPNAVPVERLPIDKTSLGTKFRFPGKALFANLTIEEAWEQYGVSWIINPRTNKPTSFVPWMLHRLSHMNWTLNTEMQRKFRKMIIEFKTANPEYNGHVFNRRRRAKHTMELL